MGYLVFGEGLKRAANKGRTSYRVTLSEAEIVSWQKKGFTIYKRWPADFPNVWVCDIDWKNPTNEHDMASRLHKVAMSHKP